MSVRSILSPYSIPMRQDKTIFRVSSPQNNASTFSEEFFPRLYCRRGFCLVLCREDGMFLTEGGGKPEKRGALNKSADKNA